MDASTKLSFTKWDQQETARINKVRQQQFYIAWGNLYNQLEDGRAEPTTKNFTMLWRLIKKASGGDRFLEDYMIMENNELEAELRI